MLLFPQASVPWPTYWAHVAIQDEGVRGEGHGSEVAAEDLIHFVALRACLKSCGKVSIEFCLAWVFLFAWKITFVNKFSALVFGKGFYNIWK